MTTVKLPEYGPEPIKLTTAVVELIANGIQIGNPAAAKALAREFIELKAENARLKAPVTHKEVSLIDKRRLEWNEDVSAGTAMKYALTEWIATRAGKEQTDVHK